MFANYVQSFKFTVKFRMRSRRRADKEAKHGCSACQIFNMSLRCSAIIFSRGRKIHPYLQTNTFNWLNQVEDEPEVRGRSCAKSTCNMRVFKLNTCRLLLTCWSSKTLLNIAGVCVYRLFCVSLSYAKQEEGLFKNSTLVLNTESFVILTAAAGV